MALSIDRKATPLFLIVLAALVGYVAYSGSLISMAGGTGLTQRTTHIAAMYDTLSNLEAQIDSAKRELAHGSVEDLRQRLAAHRASLGLLRRLVPERNEVPNLLDDISTRAKIRGVNLSQVVPMPIEVGPAPFDTHKYTLAVLGHYDQIGEFLADIATLQRIIVPYGVTVSAAQPAAAKALGDSTGAMLEAKFQIRTYVKSVSPEGDGSGA